MNQVFIDESGTNKMAGSAVVAGLYIAKKELEFVDKIVTDAESTTSIKLFHWSRHKWSVRKNFFTKVLKKAGLMNMAVVIVIKEYPFDLNSFFEEAIRIIIKEKTINHVIVTVFTL